MLKQHHGEVVLTMRIALLRDSRAFALSPNQPR
jgi:hypothetical protein